MVRLFLGGIRPLPPENRPTGIFKSERLEPVWLGQEGLAGDAHADRRAHGGPEKAFHQFPIAHYARLAATFSDVAALLVPGSMGENLSVGDWDESTVAIGDIFRIGDARIQVSQPRTPCWKIDRRYGVDGMAQYIDAYGIAGWYYRVIEEGEVAAGCVFERVERPSPQATLAHFWQLWNDPQPAPSELETLAATPALSPGWRDKLIARVAWLRRNPT